MFYIFMIFLWCFKHYFGVFGKVSKITYIICYSADDDFSKNWFA